MPRHRPEEWTVKTCRAHVNYYSLMRIAELGNVGCMCRIPCLGARPGTQVRSQMVEKCHTYEPLTEAEIQARIDEINETTRLLTEDLSPCCKAPIDHSRAITDGEYKGHGPRYCSKCHQLVYMV